MRPVLRALRKLEARARLQTALLPPLCGSVPGGCKGKRILQLGASCFCLHLSLLPGVACRPASPSKWEKDIRAFEEADRKNPPPAGAVLFIGSSSIRLWKDLKRDFAGMPTLNRGFGGSEIADATHFAERIIFPYRPRKIVLYAGDNDIAKGKSAEQVFTDFQAFVRKVRARLPEVPIYYLAIKPSPSRWKYITTVREANQKIRHFTTQEKNLRFVDVHTPMLGKDGKPRQELFAKDELHLNRRGYALWRSVLLPLLQ
jgi:lysophospholipase L1-like esterase